MIKFTPYILIKYLLKEFTFSLLIFFGIFFSLIILTNFIQEINFFKDNKINNYYIISLILTFIKTPSIIITLSPFIFLFSSIHFFVKFIKKNETSPLRLSGFSNNFLALIPSLYSFALGICIILILTPLSSQMSKFYETSKQKYNKNDNLIILSSTGIWLRQANQNGNSVIIRADQTKSENFKKLKNISIYEINNGSLIKRIESDSADINEKNIWNLKNTIITNDKENLFYKNYSFKSDIKIELIKEFFDNADVFSFWNINKEIQLIREHGYYGYELIIAFNKYLSLPFLLFSMVMLSTLFTINIKKDLNIFVYAFLGILFGIAIYFFMDLSIALGKSGKIPLILSVWFPVVIILLLSIYCLLNNNEN